MAYAIGARLLDYGAQHRLRGFRRRRAYRHHVRVCARHVHRMCSVWAYAAILPLLTTQGQLLGRAQGHRGQGHRPFDPVSTCFAAAAAAAVAASLRPAEAAPLRRG